MFRFFDTGPKHRNKPKKTCWFCKKQTENNRNRLSFGLFRFEPRKKINCFEDPLIENVCWDFFGLFQQSSVCFGCFNTSPKHRNQPKKMFFGFVKQTENNRNRLSFGLFRFEPKKKIWLTRTPYSQHREELRSSKAKRKIWSEKMYAKFLLKHAKRILFRFVSLGRKTGAP